VSRSSPEAMTPSFIRPGVAGFAWLLGWASGIVLAGLAVTVAFGRSGGSSDPVFDSIGALAMALGVAWVVWLLVLWWASVRGGSGDLRADLAMGFSRWDAVAVIAGVLAQLVGVRSLNWLLGRIWPQSFSAERMTETTERLIAMADTPAAAMTLVLLVVVGAPVIEEMVYRGMLQRSLLMASDDQSETRRHRRLRSALVVVAVSALFAAIHLRPVEYPGLFLAGLVFGGAFLISGRLAAPVLAHLGFNAAGLWLVWLS